MTFSTAFRSYLVLLFIAVVCLIIVMPTTLRFDLGKKNLCRFFRLPYEHICTHLSIAEKIPLTIPRPTLSWTMLGRTFERDLEYRFGLDVRGGTEVVLVADMAGINESDRDRALTSAKEIISKRIDLYGLSESSVTTARSQDSYRLIASIPGITRSDAILALIGTTAQLDFREYSPSEATPSATASSSGLLVKDFVSTGLTGKELSRATVVMDQETAQPVISLEFSPEGTKQFATITKRNIGKPLAIFLDEYPISAPRVDSEIIDGRAQIAGEFSLQDAQSLAATLNAGSLPVPISILSQRTLSATLGANSVAASIRAGVVGVVLVVVFLIALYGAKGLIAGISLLFYGLVTLALYKLIPVTFSLPGIAGFLLSVGMSVDTIILVFERLREEERLGGPPSMVLSRSFTRAWGSIKDANIATLISAFILANPLGWSFLNTSGMVRGFAITLALGIFLNLFTGMYVLRVLMRLFYTVSAKK